MMRRHGVCLAFALAASFRLAASPAPPPMSEMANHHFTVILKLLYSVQDYDPALYAVGLNTGVVKPSAPEAALGALVAGEMSANYSSWLAMWDLPSQQRIERERHQSNLSELDFLKGHSDLNKDTRVLSFVSRTQYVILRLVNGDKNYSAIAFKLTNNGWKATRDIDAEVALIASGSFDRTTEKSH